MTKLFSAYDIAKRRGVSPQCVYLAERRGEIKAVAETVGGRRLFSEETAKSYLQKMGVEIVTRLQKDSQPNQRREVTNEKPTR